MNIQLTMQSRNRKTGVMPVSMSPRSTCPSCPLKSAGCYADSWPLGKHWDKVEQRGMAWDSFLDSIRALPENTVWRHNQAGDLLGQNDRIDWRALSQLAKASRHTRPIVYTHYPVVSHRSARANRQAIRKAMSRGIVVNASANNLKHADQIAATGLPVVVVLPQGTRDNIKTPAGRRVVVCPAVTHGVQCVDCRLCMQERHGVIVGFPAHGVRANKASKIAEGKS